MGFNLINAVPEYDVQVNLLLNTFYLEFIFIRTISREVKSDFLSTDWPGVKIDFYPELNRFSITHTWDGAKLAEEIIKELELKHNLSVMRTLNSRNKIVPSFIPFIES